MADINDQRVLAYISHKEMLVNTEEVIILKTKGKAEKNYRRYLFALIYK